MRAEELFLVALGFSSSSIVVDIIYVRCIIMILIFRRSSINGVIIKLNSIRGKGATDILT